MNLEGEKKIFLGILFIAFLTRLVFFFSFRENLKVAERMDAVDYNAIAENLVKGRGFIGFSGEPTAVRPPVYPLFLASIYSLFGPNEIPVKTAQAVLECVSVLLLMLLAKYLFSVKTAYLAGIFYSFYPPLIIYSNLLLSECLFTCLMLAGIFCLVRAFDTGELKLFFLAGIFQGIAVLCRTLIVFVPVFLFAMVLFVQNKKQAVRGLLIYIFISGAIMSVWVVRNYKVFGQPQLTVDGGFLLWFAIQDDAWLENDRLADLSPAREYKELDGMPRHKWDKYIIKKVAAYAFGHPFSYLRKILRNTLRLWQLPVGKVLLQERSRISGSVYQLLYYLLLSFFLFGLLSRQRSGILPELPVIIFLFYMTAMFSIILPAPRYKLPFEPLILLFAARGTLAAVSKFKPDAEQ